MRVIVGIASLASLGERVEHHPLCFRRGSYQVDEIAKRQAAPFGDARPPLDAVMQRDLRLLRQLRDLCERELDRILDQAIDLQSVAAEVIVPECAPLWTVGQAGVIWPEVNADVVPVVLHARCEVVENEIHRTANGYVGDALQDSSVLPGEADRPDVEGDHERNDDYPDHDPIKVGVVVSQRDVVEIGREPGEGDQSHVSDEEQNESDHHEKVDGSCDLTVAEEMCEPAEAVIQGRGHRQTRENGQRCKDEDHSEVCELLQRVIPEEPTRAARQVNAQVGEGAGCGRWQN